MSEALKAELLEMIEADEDDVETRFVYADLLEELGEDDEAERQREWCDSKQWMVDFCETHADEPNFGYEDLMARLDDVRSDRDIYVLMGNLECLMYAIRANSNEFWWHWSILTGIVVTQDQVDEARYRCSC